VHRTTVRLCAASLPGISTAAWAEVERDEAWNSDQCQGCRRCTALAWVILLKNAKGSRPPRVHVSPHAEALLGEGIGGVRKRKGQRVTHMLEHRLELLRRRVLENLSLPNPVLLAHLDRVHLDPRNVLHPCQVFTSVQSPLMSKLISSPATLARLQTALAAMLISTSSPSSLLLFPSRRGYARKHPLEIWRFSEPLVFLTRVCPVGHAAASLVRLRDLMLADILKHILLVMVMLLVLGNSKQPRT
jgi:hypothetical protein